MKTEGVPHALRLLLEGFMFLLSLGQVVFGGAAVVACFLAILSVLRHQRNLSFYVTLSGVCALAFFFAVPHTPPPEMILLSVLMIAIGGLLIPAESQRSTRELLDDDTEVFGDSTATRRLKR